MPNNNEFEIRDGVLVKYNGDGGIINIPDGVVKIANWVFKERCICGVTIPNSVKIIGEGAFAENVISKLEIPQSVNEIGQFAFANNFLLERVSISGGVAALPKGIFDNCMSLKYITLSEGLLRIGEGAFLGCVQLCSVRLPDSLREIDNYAFGASGVDSIDIPSGIQTIGDGAFKQAALENILFRGTKEQWVAVPKGNDWNRGLFLKVACSNGKIKAGNMPKIKDFNMSSMPVKVTTVTSWSDFLDLRMLEANYVWQANYALAKRRIGYILFSLVMFAAMIFACVATFVFGIDIFGIVAEALIVPCIICFIMIRAWRKLLGGYKFYCGLRGYPTAKGFTKFLFYFCYVISTIFSILALVLFFVFILTLSFIAPSATSFAGAFSFNDRLGIPKNIGHDELIELGKEYDEAQSNEIMRTTFAVLDEIDYTISANAIESDYNLKKEQIDHIDADIKEFEHDNQEMSFETKQKLKELKSKSKEKRDKLDESYRTEKSKLDKEFGKDENRFE